MTSIHVRDEAVSRVSHVLRRVLAPASGGPLDSCSTAWCDLQSKDPRTFIEKWGNIGAKRACRQGTTFSRRPRLGTATVGYRTANVVAA